MKKGGDKKKLDTSSLEMQHPASIHMKCLLVGLVGMYLERVVMFHFVGQGTHSVIPSIDCQPRNQFDHFFIPTSMVPM